MAANPNPSHITAGMWWFIEEWERMEPATVFAGAWGREKPGYHCDAYGLWWHKDKNGVYSWRGDYSLQLADDKVLGTPLEMYGAALDITFPDAQSGNYTKIRKYSDRVKAAWAARDPRLNGWREVLCNCSDNDSAADGFDIPGHYERTPDDTHKWHMHFSCLRKYLNDMIVWQAMMSVLRGETLAQWQARGGDDDMSITTFWLDENIHGKGEGGFWIGGGPGCGRELIKDNDDMAKAREAHPNLRPLPAADHNGWPTAVLTWSVDEVNRILGRKYEPPSSGGSGGGLVDHTHPISVTVSGSGSGTSGAAQPAK